MTAEWLQTLLTGVPVLVAAFWLVLGQGRLWRAYFWRANGRDIRLLAKRWRAPLEWRWSGWALEGPHYGVVWRGGTQGSSTRIHLDDLVQSHPGFLDADAVESVIREMRAAAGTLDREGASGAP